MSIAAGRKISEPVKHLNLNKVYFNILAQSILAEIIRLPINLRVFKFLS